MHLLRTRFKEEILATFLPPFVDTKKETFPKKTSSKAIIFCDGMPGMPSRKDVLEFWSRKGYWVFHPRYRGTWESGGKFLDDSPEKDILDIIDDLSNKTQIFSLWDETAHEINIKEIYIFGGSFGGAAALLASRDLRVKKVVCVSPVVDWRAPSEKEPLDFLRDLIKRAFGEAYRFFADDWDKLKTGDFYNPAKHIKEIDGSKIMIIHAEDDDVVRFKEVKEFAEHINCNFFPLKKGRHLSNRILSGFTWHRRIKNFLEF